MKCSYLMKFHKDLVSIQATGNRVSIQTMPASDKNNIWHTWVSLSSVSVDSQTDRQSHPGIYYEWIYEWTNFMNDSRPINGKGGLNRYWPRLQGFVSFVLKDQGWIGLRKARDRGFSGAKFPGVLWRLNRDFMNRLGYLWYTRLGMIFMNLIVFFFSL